MAKKKPSKPTVSAVPPAPPTKEPEMAPAPLATGLDGSPVVIKPESEGFLLSSPTQAPLSDITDVTESASATAPFVAFLTESEHTSSLEVGQGLDQTTAEAETTPPLSVATFPAAYSTHAGVPTKQAGTYYTPQPPRLR